jgi:hypothetical protein
MIGRTLEARNQILGTVGWLLAAAVLVAIAFAARQVGWAVFAILPATIGIAFLFSQPPEFHAEVTSSELVVHSHGLTIPYGDIRRVWYAGRGAQAVYLTHARGVLRIPQASGMSAFDIYAFLCRMQTPQPPPDVHPTIRSYLHTQMHTFGMDRVWAHNARANTRESEGRRSKLVGFALLATVVLWFIAAAALQEGGWAGAALLLALIALLGYALRGSLLTVGRGIKNWRESSLVVSPAGLALAQGDLKGELRWKELRNVKLRERGTTGQRRIEMRVEGAQINIMDLYDSPISEIHRQIMHYWEAG